MEFVYAIVLRGNIQGKRWWNWPKEASAYSMGTLMALPGSTRADIIADMIQKVRDNNPQLVNTYPETIYLELNDVLVPIPDQPPVVTTGVITAIRDDGGLDVSTDRAKTPDLAEDTQLFTPVSVDPVPEPAAN